MKQRARRLVVIAGAGPGLGRALCKAFTREGATVVAVTRPGEASALRTSLGADDTRILEADLTRREQVELTIDGIEREYGIPDVAVYNAGHLVVQPFAAISEADMNECWAVNYHGAFLASQRFLRSMSTRGSGTLIFTGASASVRAVPRFAACVASKQALRGLAETLALEYEGAGVHVYHIVIDGLIWSEKVAKTLKPDPSSCMSADEIARLYVDLVDRQPSARSREMVLTAATLAAGAFSTDAR